MKSTYNVLVYKTDVASSSDADTIVNSIKKQYPEHIVFFDLLQSDKILWVEGWNTRGLIVIDALLQLGYQAETIKE